MTRARLLSLLAFVALLAACRGDITQATLMSGVDQPMVATGDDAYTLEEWGGGTFTHLDVTIENASPETISLLNCNGAYGVVLEKRVGRRWVQTWAPFLPGCLSRPIEILPGGMLRDTIRVFAGARGGPTYPQFATDQVEGTYRLVVVSAYWHYDGDGPPWGAAVPRRAMTSNAFRLIME